jgi:hypothetical protein
LHGISLYSHPLECSGDDTVAHVNLYHHFSQKYSPHLKLGSDFYIADTSSAGKKDFGKEEEKVEIMGRDLVKR